MSKVVCEVATRPAVAARANDSARLIRLLELDPELGAGITPEQRPAAISHSVATRLVFDRGPWRYRPRDNAGLGALILEGMVLVRVEFAGVRAHAELLGEGDVICPWHGMGAHPTAPCVVSARVIAKLKVALLDRAFTRRTAGWPEIHAAVMQRLVARSRALSMQSAINSLSRVEERLEITFWQLAHRFGRVTPDGIRANLPLSHSQLAEIVCARRPSVSTAIARLRDQGRLVLIARHQWLLRGDPPARLAAAGGDATGL